MFDLAWLISLVIVGLWMMLLPIKQLSCKVKVGMSIVLIGLVGIAYMQWGSWAALKKHQAKQQRILAAQELLKKYKTPDALIEKLKQKVSQEPRRAKGWYLLGRLYASQGAWVLAQQAFAMAVQLEPRNEQYAINDIDAMWNVNHQQFDEAIRQRLQQLISQNSQQPDALVMLATDAFQQKHYEKAIRYWQVLLTMTPQDSEAAQALRQAIAKAERELK